MISHTQNRVQAIKSKFENLNSENDSLIIRRSVKQLGKQQIDECVVNNEVFGELNEQYNVEDTEFDSDVPPKPNSSYLYSKTDAKRSLSDVKICLSRQSSDPGKKLHRSHAFRCDKTQKIGDSPKRHGSCNGRSETSDFSVKMGERKLSKDRLKRLGNLLEDQMRKEHFVVPNDNNVDDVLQPLLNSIPDKDVPKHILDQYAKVVKTKKEDKHDAMTDSGVSSETENLEDDKSNKIKKLMSQFEKTDPDTDANLETMNDLCVSSETMRLERKNPHLTLTDTLKKALKQPLPPGPPPKKPPRSFVPPIPEGVEKPKKDAKKMLEKLEQVLQKREAQNKNIYDEVETDLTIKKPKEIHYLCTEILDITQRTLLPNQNRSESLANCFNSLNCAVLTNSTASLPYTRLSSHMNFEPLKTCSCSVEDNSKFSSFLADSSQDKCVKCKLNDEKHDRFKCHLNCKCKTEKSEFFVDKEHIYDEPFNEEKKSQYGTLNNVKVNGHLSRSLENVRVQDEDQKIYDVPSDVSRPATPDFTTSSPKSEFQKLRDNFEKGFRDAENRTSKTGTENEEKDSTTTTELGDTVAQMRKFGTEINDNKKSGVDTADAKKGTEKPLLLSPKPNMYLKKVSKSSENIVEELKSTKRLVEKKFNTETKRYRSKTDNGVPSVLKKNYTQLDMDRENLNRLMNEIYETVTAACSMEDRRPGCFPTDQSDGSTSEDSVKLTRSLTEKRKNYVRRVSSRVAYLDQAHVKRVTRFRHQTSICSYKSEIIDNPYNTFRSWKSFRTSRTNLTKDNKMADSTDSKFNLTDSSGNILSMKDDFDSESIDKLSIDEKTGCVDIELTFEPRDRTLFNVCLLVGLNYMTGQAYVKSVFPSQVQVPPHIENLIFPETLSAASKGEWAADAAGTQCYSLVLTDERGERAYGYCRRVLPEGATTCLPLCYCLIGRYRAPGFYYKVLQEIESHHGSSEVEIYSILQQLFETDFPNPGEDITISYKNNLITDRGVRNSTNADSIAKCKTMPDVRRSNQHASSHFADANQRDTLNSFADSNQRDSLNRFADSNQRDCSNRFSESSQLLNGSTVNCDGSEVNQGLVDGTDMRKFLDLENNNDPKRVMLNLESRRTRTIKRPIEPRVDEDNLSILLDSFGAGLVIKVFSSLLLERKVVIISDKLSVVSSCMEALQGALYPFVWQQPLIAAIPAEIQRDVLEAPLPILAGMLKTASADYAGITFEEGMLIDLTSPSKVLFYQGDESTILPTSSYKSLKTSLQMESTKHKDRSDDIKTRNVMISEAFLRFFVDILGDFWKYFSVGALKDGDLGKGNILFDKDAYIKGVSSKQNQYFLEWFTETAMFNHFIQNMCARFAPTKNSLPFETTHSDLVDTPLPYFYELLDERLKGRTGVKNVDKGNYKSAVNKKVKLLKTKLRDLIT